MPDINPAEVGLLQEKASKLVCYLNLTMFLQVINEHKQMKSWHINLGTQTLSDLINLDHGCLCLLNDKGKQNSDTRFLIHLHYFIFPVRCGNESNLFHSTVG